MQQVLYSLCGPNILRSVLVIESAMYMLKILTCGQIQLPTHRPCTAPSVVATTYLVPVGWLSLCDSFSC